MRSSLTLKEWILGILFLLSLLSSNAHSTPFHVVIDPGHGGTDDGANREGIREASITLSIAQHLVDLIKTQTNFNITLTRDTDTIRTLNDRTNIAELSEGDLFLSIHCNSSPDPHARGAEFYFLSNMNRSDESMYLANAELKKGHNDVASILHDLKRTNDIYRSQQLAETLQKVWKTEFHVRDRAIRQETFHVLLNVPMPSVLAELGFISNKKERERLADPLEQKKMAKLLFDGIKFFKEKIDKTENSRHITANTN